MTSKMLKSTDNCGTVPPCKMNSPGGVSDMQLVLTESQIVCVINQFCANCLAAFTTIPEKNHMQNVKM